MRWLLASTLAVLVACGGSTPPPTSPLPPDKPIEQAPGTTPVNEDAAIAALAERACACKDPACARQVIHDLVTRAQNNKNPLRDAPAAEAAGDRIGRCVMKAGMPGEELLSELKKIPVESEQPVEPE